MKLSEPCAPLCPARKGLAGYLYCLSRPSAPLKQFISWGRPVSRISALDPRLTHSLRFGSRPSERVGPRRTSIAKPLRVRPQYRSSPNTTRPKTGWRHGPSRHRHTQHTHTYTDTHTDITQTSQTAMDRVACGCQGRPGPPPPPLSEAMTGQL